MNSRRVHREGRTVTPRSGTLFTAEDAEDAELRGGEEAMATGIVLFPYLCDPLRPLR
jgi:hypothetical protein